MIKPFLPSYMQLGKGIAMSEDGRTVSMSRELFDLFIGTAALACAFDPVWYRVEYPDIGAEVANGAITDELEHFLESGYEEGRTPAYFDVDEEWYLTRFPDVADAIASGVVEDADEHYNEVGYGEGRAPSPEMLATVERWIEAIDLSAELLDETKAVGT